MRHDLADIFGLPSIMLLPLVMSLVALALLVWARKVDQWEQNVERTKPRVKMTLTMVKVFVLFIIAFIASLPRPEFALWPSVFALIIAGFLVWRTMAQR